MPFNKFDTQGQMFFQHQVLRTQAHSCVRSRARLNKAAHI